MKWRRIVLAAVGHPEAIADIVLRGTTIDSVALATLLLLDETPSAAAALAAARSWGRDMPLLSAALAPSVAPALADWRADPQWVDHAVGAEEGRAFIEGVVALALALSAYPAALRDAVAIVVRDGDSEDVAHCLDALGAAEWAALEDDQRAALLARVGAGSAAQVWSATDEVRRAAATTKTATDPDSAAARIGSGGAWRATDPTERQGWIESVGRAPHRGRAPAPAGAFPSLGAADRRAALERHAVAHPDPWRVLALRAADAGWGALSDEERAVVLAAAERQPWDAPDLLRTVGAAGWRAMQPNERERLAAVVRRTPDALFACPPALWCDLAQGRLLPAGSIAPHIRVSWRAEDADADLGALPPAHQAVVLALASWRRKDVEPDSIRLQRLIAVWNALPTNERVALAVRHPGVPASVAAAARLRGGASAAIDAVGETLARLTAAPSAAAVKRAVGAMLRAPGDWRAWMVAFTPTNADPPEVWNAWRRAARRGFVPNPAICARLAAEQSTKSTSRRALRRP